MFDAVSQALGGGAYLWIKAFHIFAVIAWMAGLLYLPRLFVYHVGATPGGELDETLKTQEVRLFRGIMNPSMIAVWLLGLAMIIGNPVLLSRGWMWVKLALVIVMTGVHHIYGAARKKFAIGANTRTARYWRIVNEIPALIAIGVIIMAVVEPF